MNEKAKLELCVGCHNDFYNGKNSINVKRCWHFATARPVTRYKIGWWTPPTSRDAFQKVKTLSCHHAPGEYELRESLPTHLVAAPGEAGERP